MKLDLKIAQKGLIMVAVPLAFELIFVGSLAWLRDQAEAESMKHARSRRIAAETEKVIKSFYDAGVLVTLQGLRGDPDLTQRCDVIVEQIPEQFKQLRKLAEENGEKLGPIDQLEQLGNQALALLIEIREASETGDRAAFMNRMSQLHPDFKSLTQRFFLDAHAIIQNEEKLQSLLRTAETRNLVTQCLWGGVLVNICLAIVLALFFSKQITGGIGRLVDNTRRLQSGRELNPIMQGRDEIAQLDRVFHEMADALSEARRRELELDRLKQEFLAIVSHDLRTPLTSLQGNMTILQAGVAGPVSEQAAQILQSSERSIDRLIRLINDLLDMEKLESGGFEMQMCNVYLQDVIDASVDAVRPFARQHSISVETKTTEEFVLADGDRLEQVVVNFLSNAIKFSPANATVTVQVIREQSQVELQVIDHGRGIPPEMHEAVFDRFRQVSRSDGAGKKGTGLGLAICKAIVEQLGGKIGVHSEQGKGSTFFFRLPAVHVEASTDSRVETSETSLIT